MKSAVIRWNNKGVNVKRHKQPMKIDNVVEIGEGPNFIHIFTDGSQTITEVNLHSRDVESVTVFETLVEPEGKSKMSIVDKDGNPISENGDASEMSAPEDSELPN
jgi:hypothetical protein